MGKDLFGVSDDPFFSGPVSHNLRRTSLISAKFLEKGTAAKRRKQVYEYIKSCGENGATDEEIEIGTGLKHQTVSGSAGRNGLLEKGIVYDSGKRRKNLSGREAMVWIAKEIQTFEE